MSDRDERDLQGMLGYWRAQMLVGGVLLLGFGVFTGVRALWGILRFVIPGGTQ